MPAQGLESLHPDHVLNAFASGSIQSSARGGKTLVVEQLFDLEDGARSSGLDG
jgi:hypothetical protein